MEIDGAQRDPIIEATLLLLAGGESRRMGRPKALLPVEGRTLIEWQVQRLAPEFAETLIAAAAPEQVPAALQASAVLDRQRGRGPLGGLEAGLSAARMPVVVVLACDVPSFSARLARTLVTRLVEEPRADAAVPETPRGLEPLAAAYRREAALGAVSAALRAGDLRVRAMLDRLGSLIRVSLPELPNLNTPSDYQAFLDN